MLLISFLRRLKSTISDRKIRVAVIGACGSIGTNMSLLLKMNPLINEIVLCDVVQKVHGIALDLSQVSTPCKVRGYFLNTDYELKRALLGCNIVMITAGRRRKYDMNMYDLFNSNAETIRTITMAILQSCPDALTGIITSPVSALIPLINDIIEREGVGDRKRVFGVTTVDVIRAKTIIGEARKLNPMVVDIPMIGGHTSRTIVPLISRSTPITKFDEREIKELTDKIRNVGNDIIDKKRDGGATISMAYAGARMTSSLARAVLGAKDITECAFVRCDNLISKYLCLPVVIDEDGVRDYYNFDNLTDFEQRLLSIAIDDLRKYIKLGENYLK